MRPPTPDLLAGTRARRISADPGAPERISDPMDPRYGELSTGLAERAEYGPQILDPTNPACGQPAS